MGKTGSTRPSLIDDYSAALRLERGFSEHTIAAYRRDLDEFAQFLEERGEKAVTACPGDLQAFEARLMKRGLKATSICRKLSAIHGFQNFAYREGERGDL